MKKLVYVFTLLFLTSKIALSSTQIIPATIDVKSIIVNKLESFIKEKKFQPDETLMYPGITSKTLKSKLTELINESAKDFMQIANDNASDEKYQEKIKAGLERFNTFFSDLSSEDLDRIYQYYEQLIQIVGLKNPGNILKNWRYGSMPSVKK